MFSDRTRIRVDCAKRPCEAELAAVTNGSLMRSSLRSGLQHAAECLDYLRIHRIIARHVAGLQKLFLETDVVAGFQNFRLVGIGVASHTGAVADREMLRVRDG